MGLIDLEFLVICLSYSEEQYSLVSLRETLYPVLL
jgi:hypothetical protein